MKPYFVITANGSDITDKLNSRLIKLSLKDDAGFKNDRLEIELADYEPFITMPEEGTEFKVWIGYKGALVYKGKFILDEITCGDNPQSTMHITAHAEDTGSGFKASKNRSWHGKTIGDIVKKIAGDHKMSPKVESGLAKKKIQHRDQTHQSDMAFLTHLANENDAIMKVADGNLYFAPRNQYKSLTGQGMQAVTIDRTECKSYSFKSQRRGEFKGVKAKYRKQEDGKEYYANEGEDSPDGMYALHETFKTKDDAKAAAKGRHKAMKRAKETIDMVVAPGNQYLEAEGHMNITGFRPGIRTEWLMSSVSHDFDGSGGYTTKINGTVPDEGEGGGGGGSGKSGSKGGSGGKGGSGKGGGDGEKYANEGEDAPKGGAGGGDKEEKEDNQEEAGNGGSGGGSGGSAFA